MRHAFLSFIFIFLVAGCSFAQDKPVLNDPAQNPLGAKAVLSEGLAGSLDGDVRLVLTLANPTQDAVTFNQLETLFIVGEAERGQPLYADRITAEPLMPGQTAQLHFRYENPQHIQYVSAYVWLDFTTGGQRQRTALFIKGPKQAAFIDRWQSTYFPYGHVSGLYAAPGAFLLP